MNKLVALLRVKDGILFIQQWLNRTSKLVDEIVVVDNGSTDGTFEIIKNHPKVVSIKKTVGFDEGRDKVLLYEMARQRNPDWCLWLDVDEIFEERVTREDFEKLMNNDKNITKYLFRLFNFHKDYYHFEASILKLMEQSFGVLRMWKEQKTGYFINIKIHNGSIQGIKGNKKLTNFRIKHIGAVDKKYLQRKTELYEKIDKDPKRKTIYRKHLEQKLPTWRWYEYNENPFKVGLQLLFFTFLNPFARVYFFLNRKIK